jgi:sugar phosphate isomerase/epimerase
MTRFSVSNIAWAPDCEDEAVDLAAACGFAGIELAPMKIFGPLDACPPERMEAYRANLARRGLAVPALQAILFGVKDCALFGSAEDRARLAAHLRSVARTAGRLGARACVFGAPGLRDPGDLPPADAFAIAVEFFQGVAAAFEDAGSAIAFEANPTYYQCRFVTGTAEAAELVRAVDRPGFRLNIDTGTVFINGEDPASLARFVPVAIHFHASEQDLAPVGRAGADHPAVAAALAHGDYRGWRSVEMRASPDWRDNMRSAATLMREVYG